MSTETVDIEFRAKLATLKAELASIQDLDKKVAAQIASDWRKAWRQAEKEGTTALGKVAKEAGDLAKLGSLVGGQLGGAIADVADVAELAHAGLSGMTLAVGGIGMVIGVVAGLSAAIIDVVSNVEDFDLTASRNAETIVEAASAYEAMTGELRALQVEVVGEVSPALVVLFDAVSGGSQILQEGVDFAGQYTWALGWLEEGVETLTPALDALHAALSAVALVGEDSRRSAEEHRKEIERYTAALDEEIRVEQAQAETEAALTARTQAQLDKIKSDWEEAERAAKKAAAEAKRRAEEELRLAETRARAAEQARDIVLAASLSVASEEDRLLAQRQDAVDRYVEAAQKGALSEQEIAMGRYEILAAYEIKLDELRDRLAARAQEREQAWIGLQEASQAALVSMGEALDGASALQQAAGAAFDALGYDLAVSADGMIEETKSSWNDIIGYVQQGAAVIGQISALVTRGQLENLDETSEAYEKAQQRRVVSEKLAALAQIAVSTAAGAVNAMAQAPGPVGAGLAALMGVFGAAQAAVVGATNYHVGGMVEPDTMQGNLLRGEGVLSRTGVAAAGGKAAVESMNRGHAPGASTAPMALLALDGRVVDWIWSGAGGGRAGLEARVQRMLSGGIPGRAPVAR